MSKPLEWDDLWSAMDYDSTQWVPTTEGMYWQMLECLPPRAMANGAFLVGEAIRDNTDGEAVHACFKQVGECFYARNMTVNEFRSAA